MVHPFACGWSRTLGNDFFGFFRFALCLFRTQKPKIAISHLRSLLGGSARELCAEHDGVKKMVMTTSTCEPATTVCFWHLTHKKVCFSFVYIVATHERAVSHQYSLIVTGDCRSIKVATQSRLCTVGVYARIVYNELDFVFRRFSN